MNNITNHIFETNFKNNTQWYEDEYQTVKGIKFHDFSYAQPTNGKGLVQPVAGSILNNITSKYIKQALESGQLDKFNKMLSMMFINWNGAEIENGNFANGENAIISDTPEFLKIFNNLTSTVYEKIIVENSITNRVARSKVKTVNMGQDITNPTPGDNTFKSYEIWDVLYINTSSTTEYEITFKNNAVVTELGSNVKMKVPGGAEDLVIVVPAGGYGEVNYLRIDNNVYVRGV